MFRSEESRQVKPVYAVFDCLFADRKDLRQEPLAARRIVLERVVASQGVLLLSQRVAAAKCSNVQGALASLTREPQA